MKRFFHACMIVAAVIFIAPRALFAQEATDVVKDAQEALEQWVAAANDFAGNVRFDEGDMKSFLANWKSLEEAGEEMAEGEDDEEFIDFQSLLKDPRYAKWAKSRNVNAEEWLRKSVRIFTIVMGEKMAGAMAEAEQAVPEQMAAFEAQRAQMGEEMYRQMKEAIDASMAITKMNREMWSKLPTPTPKEAALLKKYDAELTELIVGEDEEDGYDYDAEYGGEDDDR